MRRLLVVVSLLCSGIITLPAAAAAVAAKDRGVSQTAAQAAAGRSKTLLNPSWRFLGGSTPLAAEGPDFNDKAWAYVSVPHTWANITGWPTYSHAWYRTDFSVASLPPGARVYLFFEGVATLADVYVNGQHLGQHRGAYTACCFDATAALHADGKNLLAVHVSNDPVETKDCLPSGKANMLYWVYGGIYRKAWLVVAPAVHVFPELGSSGVFIAPKNVSETSAELYVRTAVRNSTSAAGSYTVRHRVRDAQGAETAVLTGNVTVPANATADVTIRGEVKRPRLWSPASPHLYSVETEILDGSKLCDQVVERTGIRWIQLTPEGFRLNGAQLLIRGVAKHQETEYRQTAVSDADLRTDFDNLQDLGVNSVRLPHYPHARLEYDLADERGILVWAENGHSNEGGHSETGDLITREMVRQNFNHPSIVFWSCGNEANGAAAAKYAEVIRGEDGTRLITYASNGAKPKTVDFLAFNVYQGWYNGPYTKFNDRIVSETGAGGSIATHCPYGQEKHSIDRYEPEEYQQIVAEQRCQVMFRDKPETRPMLYWWAFREFGNNKYLDRNSKGLLTYANFKKDVYYLFKTFLRPNEPVVHIASKTYFVRTAEADNGIKVYSNLPRLTLSLNGVSQGQRANGQYQHAGGLKVDNVFFWKAKLFQGRNEVVVSDGRGHSDRGVLYFAGEGGLPAAEDKYPLVVDLRSSNPENPAYFLGDEVRAQWPVYYECGGHADNTFDELPADLAGAQRIATRRTSNADQQTDLSFSIGRWAPGADVYVVFAAEEASQKTEKKVHSRPITRTPHPTAEAFQKKLAAAEFVDAGLTGQWRDSGLNLVALRVYRKSCKAGEAVKIDGAALDYAVLVKPRGAEQPKSK
jgi:beta-galactosidase